jgi:hypothetical protein
LVFDRPNKKSGTVDVVGFVGLLVRLVRFGLI